MICGFAVPAGKRGQVAGVHLRIGSGRSFSENRVQGMKKQPLCIPVWRTAEDQNRACLGGIKAGLLFGNILRSGCRHWNSVKTGCRRHKDQRHRNKLNVFSGQH